MVSRTYVVPISATQDTAGPMTKSVHDAALLLSAMAGSDPLDPATAEADTHKTDFTAGLDEFSLQGVRIGVMRNQVGNVPGVTALFEQALSDFQSQGAVLVDVEYNWPDNFWGPSFAILLYELQRDLEGYLSTLDDPAMPDNLADILAFNEANADRELRWFGQDIFEQSLETTDEAAYREALASTLKAVREDGIDRLLAEHDVKFLVAPTTGPAWSTDLVNGDNFNSDSGAGSLPAIAGYPHLTVPMGAVGVQRDIYERFVTGEDIGIEFFHGYTYSAHPMACAAGIAALEIYQEEKLFDRVAGLESYWEEKIHALADGKNVIDIRNIGLVGAIEISARDGEPGKRGFEAMIKAFEKGAMVRVTGDIIALSPPFIISRDQIDELLDLVRDVLNDLD